MRVLMAGGGSAGHTSPLIATADALSRLRPEVDEVVCLMTPDFLGAIGSFYRDFRQLGDDEVIRLLEQAAQWADAAAPRGPETDPERTEAVPDLMAALEKSLALHG